MEIITSKEYSKRKIEFLHKHEDWNTETTPMDADGKYMKYYNCEDGAQWIEVNRPVYEEVEFEVKGVKVRRTIKLFETESWNTDNARSIFVYEEF